MNGPGRGDNRLFILHDNMPGFLALAHHVENHLIFGNFKIEIDFHSALVCMCRHRVPDGTGSEHGHAHGELACLEHGGMNELIDYAFIAGLHVTAWTLGSVFQFQKPCLITGVCRGGNEVELGRLAGVLA